MVVLEDAKKIAIGIGNKIFPFCDRLNIAGSIRRGKLEVGDIEIVCQPKRVMKGTVTLFGEDDRKEIIHPEFAQIVMGLGKVIKGKPEGRMMQIELKNPLYNWRSVQLDLFMPMPYDYFRQYAIRTGSAEYSQKVIARGWLKRGWVGTSEGLRREDECYGYKLPDGKTKWSIRKELVNPTLPPAWKDEKEFFDWLGVQYLPPHVRYV